MEEYEKELESDSRLKEHCSGSGHITAVATLEHFKRKGKAAYPWIHLDIASLFQNHIFKPKGGTGQVFVIV